MAIPPRLAEVIDALDMADDRTARIQMLIDIAGRYREVPPAVAARPFDEHHRVKGCESSAFVWATARADGTLDYFFAVDNPQGITARALVVVLGDALAGLPVEDAEALDRDVVYEIFGRELSIGKTVGLTGIVSMVKTCARKAVTSTPSVVS